MATSNLTMPSADTGSNYHFGDKMVQAKPPRSAFDLTHLSTFDIANAGVVYPVCKPIETIPGDSFDISVSSLIRYLTQVVPLYSRQRLYIYAFYSRMGDLWANFDTFMKKGLNGNKILQIPTLNKTAADLTSNITTYSGNKYVKPGTIGDHLGLPIGLNLFDEIDNGGYNKKINAMPFMMYTRIWRDYFANPNLFLTMDGYNEALFPDNDDDFRLGDDGIIISFKKNNATLLWNPCSTDSTSTYKYGIYFSNNNVETEGTGNIKFMQMGLFFQNWADDRFTDALPFPQRGDEKTLDTELIFDTLFNESTGTDAVNTYIRQTSMGVEETTAAKLRSLMIKGNADSDEQGVASYMIGDDEGSQPIYRSMNNTTPEMQFNTEYNEARNQRLVSKVEDIAKKLNLRIAEDITAKTSITLNKLRELAIDQNEKFKMAMTDGSYEQFIQTFFAKTPKNAKNYHPVFIGGTYTDIHFTEVLQTGTNTEQNPLGEYAGHGIGGTDKEYLGHIECDDYGYIMILACIAPDTYYCQGLDKMYTKSMQSEMYLPERARMGMVPILNEELYALNASMAINKGLFGYNMPYDELRYRANEIHGQIADMNKTSFKSYTQARIFEDTPTLNYKFDEMRSHPELNEASQPSGGVRKDYLAAQIESMATAQFKINIRAVRPLMYKASPAEVLN